MKGYWKICDKPRGMHMPRMEFGIILEGEEENFLKNLKVREYIDVCIAVSEENTSPPQKSFLCPAKQIGIIFPENVYSDPNKERKFCGYKPCSECNLDIKSRNSLTITFKNNFISFYLPWRPGKKPDYSDFIKPIKSLLYLVLEEYNERINIALESPPSDEWGYEEEFSLDFVRKQEVAPSSNETKKRVIRAGL